MKRIIQVNVLFIFILALVSVTHAGKGVDAEGNFLGNGFPSGPHFNLNIIFKKSQFTCPDQEYLCPDGTRVTDCSLCSDTAGPCTPIYGGVIFAPQEPGNDPVTILMESGKKGPKGNPTATSLEVTDPCTQTIDGNTAKFRLPANDKGYAVYATVRGDPKQNPQFDLTNPRLHYVTDENGNELLWLGFVTTVAYGPDGQVLSRYDSGRKGRKGQDGTDITAFFMWTGSVCYFDATDYCSGGDCTTVEYCCLDVDGNLDYENCAFLSNVGVDPGSGVLECPTDIRNWCCIDTDSDSLYDYCEPVSDTVCPQDYDLQTGALSNPVEASCKTYGEPTWIFNIADFVGFLFDVESDKTNTGSVVLKLRFYPLPLNTK